MLPLDAYCSELDDESTTDVLRDGGCEKEWPDVGKAGTLTFHWHSEPPGGVVRLIPDCSFQRLHSDML